jgi:hypothetical protein
MSKRPSGLRPGETVPVSGLYQQIGPRGGKGSEVTSVKGEPLPLYPSREPHTNLSSRRSTNPGSKARALGGPEQPSPPNLST